MLYNDPRNSPKAHRPRIVTLSNQSDFGNVNLPVVTEASPFSYHFWFCSHGDTIVSVVNISHQNKQKKSHLLTEFIKHRRTRGKFILLNLRTTVPFVTAHLEIFHCTHHPVIPQSNLYFTFCSTLNALSKRTSK